jgi:hypothetical protein
MRTTKLEYGLVWVADDSAPDYGCREQCQKGSREEPAGVLKLVDEDHGKPSRD